MKLAKCDAGASCFEPSCGTKATCTSAYDCPAPPTLCFAASCETSCCGARQSGLCTLDVDSDQPCAICMQAMCASEVWTCSESPECAALAACFAGCADPSCIASCRTQHPGGEQEMDVYLSCANQQCTSECTQ
jgi:hypothetical protein